MTTATTAPAVLFRIPENVGKPLVREHRDFVLRDDPEDTRMVNLGYQVAHALDAEVGSLVRARMAAETKESRAYFMREAERFAAVAGELLTAIRELDERWSKRDQVRTAATPESVPVPS